MRLTVLSIMSGLMLVLTLSACSPEADGISLDELSEQTHFHGIAFDRTDPEQLYLATHHGFYNVGNDGLARQISDNSDDFMGFTPHPTDADTLYASGHPQRGGNMGVMVSNDGGETWTRRAEGANGPVDFHQMTASTADADVLYGAFHGQLQASRDAGRQWEIVAPAPQGLIDLTASAFRVNYLYAATKNGLLMSTDAGRNWRYIHPNRQPVSMVENSAEGDLYAFMLGSGLLRSREGNLDWQVINSEWGEGYLLHLDIDPDNAERLVAIDHQSQILISEDGGSNWTVVGTEQQ